MAYPSQPQQPPTQPFTGQVPGSYQFVPATAPGEAPPGGHDMGGVGHFPQPQGYPGESQVQANPNADPYAPTVWGQFTDFRCPSGQRCALRPIDLSELLGMGLIEDINALTGIVEKDVIRPAQGLPPLKAETLMKDGNRVANLMRVVDQIVCAVVARPALTLSTDEEGNKIPEVNRKVGLVYVDSVGLGDRIAIFNESLKGVKELESFRQAAAEPSGSVVGQQGGTLPTERGVRSQG